MKKILLLANIVLFGILLTSVSCSSEDDGNGNGLPSANTNATKPTIAEEDETKTLPSLAVSEYDEATGILTASMLGISSTNNDGTFVELIGTGEKDQNVWIDIDGVPVGFTVINGEEAVALSRAGVSTTKTLADLIFLVDNSGSMSQEANTVAEQLIDWSNELSEIMDIQFGCVGYSETRVSGAIDLTDVTSLSTYLNRYTGTNRTVGYDENISSEVESAASSFYVGGECGAMAAYFADTYFTFRDGANRIYVNLTDEPNQFSSSHYEWSVESFNENAVSPYSYLWSSNKGSIHTVMSDDGYYDNRFSTYNEDPAYMSYYTGGTAMVGVDSSYTGVNLSDLSVTGAIVNSYIFKIDFSNINTGTHTITVTIYDTITGVYSVQDFEITI